MAPKFIFIRHGEAQHNVAYHESGVKVFEDEKYRDAALTDLGIQQAQKTARNLPGLQVLDIWCSPLTRCIQTASEVFEETNAQHIYLHDNLLERLGGRHLCNERKMKHELEKLYPFLQTAYLAEIPMYWVQRENLSSLYFRMLMIVLLLANRYESISEDFYIVIVSHKDAIFALTGRELENAEALTLSLDEILTRDKNLIESNNQKKDNAPIIT